MKKKKEDRCGTKHTVPLNEMGRLGITRLGYLNVLVVLTSLDLETLLYSQSKDKYVLNRIIEFRS